MITTRKMISASMALLVIWLPQVGPTNWTVSVLGGMWKACCSATAMCCCVACDSALVVAVHCGASLTRWETTSWTVESPPPLTLTIREISPCTWEVLPWLGVEGNAKIVPPLKSTEKFRPCTIRAIALTSTMRPEIVYQVRWRPTKLTETSPRYSRPAIPPTPAIMPPSRSVSRRRRDAWLAAAERGPYAGSPIPARATWRRAAPGQARTICSRR